jgi:hypothetical protein
VFKACLNFSVETDLEKLVQNLLWIVIQYAGASRGTLILRKEQNGEEWDNALTVSTDSRPISTTSPDRASLCGNDDPDLEELDEAQDPSNDETPLLMVGGDLADLLPLSMLNYVVRTREMCVLNNLSSREGMFSSDPYFQSVAPKAVLMFPIIHQVHARFVSFSSFKLDIYLNTRFSVFGFRFSVFGFRFSVFGFRFSVFGFRFSVFGFRFSVFGFWFSVSIILISL